MSVYACMCVCVLLLFGKDFVSVQGFGSLIGLQLKANAVQTTKSMSKQIWFPYADLIYSDYKQSRSTH